MKPTLMEKMDELESSTGFQDLPEEERIRQLVALADFRPEALSSAPLARRQT